MNFGKIRTRVERPSPPAGRDRCPAQRAPGPPVIGWGDHRRRRPHQPMVARYPKPQGCSTLLTEAPVGQSIKPRQSGGVSVLTEGADFIPAQHVVSEAAQPGEDAGVVAYAGLIFLKGDIASVVQCVLDVPVVSNCDGRGACRDAEIGHIICDLGCAGPQAILCTSLQDIAGDADEELGQGLPFSDGHSLGRAKYRDHPGFMSVSRGGDLGVSADGLPRGAGGFGNLQQRRLIFL